MMVLVTVVVETVWAETEADAESDAELVDEREVDDDLGRAVNGEGLMAKSEV